VAEKRREQIFQPRAKRLAKICKELNLEVTKIIDVGAGYGIFLDEWRNISPESEMIAIEPMPSLANECRNKGLIVFEEIAEQVKDLNNFGNLVVCFEVFEHVYDPLNFIQVLKKMTRPGGYVFISTLCIDGFDLQMLWNKSNQISPPHHINFLSIDGFKSLFHRAELIDITVMTPGKLDVDIVKNNKDLLPELFGINSFLKRIIDDDPTAKNFQQFLADNQLSSHAWIMGKKKD
jgi:SAM-dependent methyltransferase